MSRRMSIHQEIQMWQKITRRLEWCVAEMERSRQRRTPRSQRPRCGARTRTGGMCRAPVVWCEATDEPRNGRCRIHGGLSTGPRTDAGKERIRESNRRRAKKPTETDT